MRFFVYQLVSLVSLATFIENIAVSSDGSISCQGWQESTLR